MVVLFQNLYLIKKIVVNEQSYRKQEIAAFLAWEKEPHIWANAQEGSISWSIRGVFTVLPVFEFQNRNQHEQKPKYPLQVPGGTHRARVFGCLHGHCVNISRIVAIQYERKDFNECCRRFGARKQPLMWHWCAFRVLWMSKNTGIPFYNNSQRNMQLLFSYLKDGFIPSNIFIPVNSTTSGLIITAVPHCHHGSAALSTWSSSSMGL